MKTTVALGVAALAAALLAAAPAAADHKTLMPSDDVKARTDGSLDLDLKLGLNGFRFGGRLFGREGYSGGAWLNGETRSDGFSLDGRVERDGRAHNFKMNVDVDEWLRRAIRWWQGTTDL
jgi:hypothetical protein